MLESTASRRNIAVIWLVLALAWPAQLPAQESEVSTAPWDFRDTNRRFDLQNVERYHFNLDVQMLRRGQSASDPGPDLIFILEYFPNHHGALNAMGRLWRMHRDSPVRVPAGLSPIQT